MRNCPDVTIFNYLFGLCLLSFCPFIFFYFLLFCLFVFLSCSPFVMLSCCLFVMLSFCLFIIFHFCNFDFLSVYLFVYLSLWLFVSLSFFLFVFLSFCIFLLSFCLDIMLIKCLKGLKCQKSLFVSKFRSGSQSVSDWLTKVMYRPARAAKKELRREKIRQSNKPKKLWINQHYFPKHHDYLIILSCGIVL